MDFGRYQRTSNHQLEVKLKEGLAIGQYRQLMERFSLNHVCFFQLSFFIEHVPGLIPLQFTVSCEIKREVVYIPDAIKAVIPTATPECILLDFESAAVSAFRTAFTTAMLALLGVIST